MSQISLTTSKTFQVSAIVFIILSLSASLLAGQEFSDTCKVWQEVSSKRPDATLSIKLSTSQKGIKSIQWKSAEGEFVTLEIRKAKSLINAQGKITLCETAKLLIISASSIKLESLKSDYNLKPGYYAICVTYGVFKNTSNWFTFQLK